MSFSLDPASFLEAHLVHLASATLGVGTFDLDAAEWIDIGKYDHVLLVAANSGGTGTIDITPRESLSQGGAEVALDGTGGMPDFRISFAGSEFELKQRIIRVSGRKQFLNVQIVIGTAAARPCVILYGIRRLIGSGQNLEADIAPLQVA